MYVKNLVYFGHLARMHFGGNTPKLVECVNFRNFGFKVNLITKLYQSKTNALPHNVNGGEFVQGCST